MIERDQGKRNLRVARNSGGNVFRNVVLVVATIAGGASLGYYVIGGAHPSQTPNTPGVQEAPMPPAPAPAPAPVTPQRKPTQVSSDYTAPNAPRIHIVEDKTPTLNDSAARPKDAQPDSGTTPRTSPRRTWRPRSKATRPTLPPAPALRHRHQYRHRPPPARTRPRHRTLLRHGGRPDRRVRHGQAQSLTSANSGDTEAGQTGTAPAARQDRHPRLLPCPGRLLRRRRECA